MATSTIKRNNPMLDIRQYNNISMGIVPGISASEGKQLMFSFTYPKNYSPNMTITLNKLWLNPRNEGYSVDDMTSAIFESENGLDLINTYTAVLEKVNTIESNKGLITLTKKNNTAFTHAGSTESINARMKISFTVS